MNKKMVLLDAIAQNLRLPAPQRVIKFDVNATLVMWYTGDSDIEVEYEQRKQQPQYTDLLRPPHCETDYEYTTGHA